MKVKEIREAYCELRRCEGCSVEHMYRIDVDGNTINKKCPECGSDRATVLKVYGKR